jgi:hypothetical protein
LKYGSSLLEADPVLPVIGASFLEVPFEEEGHLGPLSS